MSSHPMGSEPPRIGGIYRAPVSCGQYGFLAFGASVKNIKKYLRRCKTRIVEPNPMKSSDIGLTWEPTVIDAVLRLFCAVFS